LVLIFEKRVGAGIKETPLVSRRLMLRP